jgi:glycosyltransferase involved in cell wall biosynthesis
MRIAVNTRFLLHDQLEGVGIVTDEVMKRMVKSHPYDEFDYYFDRKYHSRFVQEPTIHPHVFAPVTRLPLLIRWWLNHPVRQDVIKNNVDVFFSPDGFIPLGMSVPKVSMFHDVAYLRYPEHLQPRIRNFYAKWMPRYMAETDHIITVSEFSKKEIIDGYKINPDKISVVYNGITDSYQPLDDVRKTEVRQEYTQGRPYFLYLGAIHPRKNVLTLVRAFEQYKTSANNDYQLIVAGRSAWHTEDVFQAIEKSKFKNDIHLPGYVSTDNATSLVGAATAMIYPSLYEGFGLPVVEAMACGVPVICSNVSSLPEVAGGAALLFYPMDVDQLSKHLQSITTDEKLRNDLIRLGLEKKKFFSWDKAAEEIYTILEKVASKPHRIS